MPVTSPNSDYILNQPLWSLVRDCVKGEHAIKAGGTKYLPKPSGQSEADYKRYTERVHFTDFTGRTADGLHGNIFSRRPVQTGDVPESLQYFLENVDKAGTSLEQFASDVCWDFMQTGWGGILVDHSFAPEGISTAEKEQLGLTAFMKWYAAENLINWRYDSEKEKSALSLVVLKEVYPVFDKDEFFPKEEVQYRVLRLVDGVYTQQLYKITKDVTTKQKEYLPVTEALTPLLDGKPLDFIPFFPCPALMPEKSMLLGLAYENIGHYQKTADYEQDIHYTAIHTPYVTGMKAPIDPITKKPMNIQVGSSSFIFFEGDGEKLPHVGYLETNGSDNILKAIQACEERMAILGARIISVEKKGVETAEAARIHRAGENAVLGAFARNMSEKLTLAARLGARWRGVAEEVTEQWSIALNIDYEGDLTQITEKRVGLLEIEAGLMSKKRYLKEFEGMTEDEALLELKDVEVDTETPTQTQDDFGLNEFVA